MLLQQASDAFDFLYRLWCRPAASKCISALLILVFLSTALVISLGCLGALPQELSAKLPQNPFFSIQAAFTFILFTEVVAMVFSIPESVSLAVSKQMEIMALLLLRESFSDIGLLSADINLNDDGLLLAQIAATAVAGLLLFVFRGIFLRLYKVQACDEMQNYINAKKLVCLFLFAAFITTAFFDLFQAARFGQKLSFFKTFYTLLIFTDILLILVGQYFHTSFHSIFRNSGFAVSTLLMRIALGAPHYLAATLCIFSGLYLLALAWTDTSFVNTSCKKAPEAKNASGA